jgi:aspartyl-tRNA(Asn)/glutamyl-tRNA(Gln) amidotransferase subunit A
LTDRAADIFRELGCPVDLVDRVFDTDPEDLWTAEFYAGVGIRLRSFMENERERLDPAVADVLEPALSQDMRDYYTEVFARYALRQGQCLLRQIRF